VNPFSSAQSGFIDRIDDNLCLDAKLAIGVLEGFIRNEVNKVGFSKAVVALSGGIDSALSLAVAARAMGPGNVLALLMPYRTSSPASRNDAEELVEKLGVQSKIIDVSDMVDAYVNEYELSNIRKGNVMARARMIALYDHSEEFTGLVVGTSNKTELLLGYGTIYGDMASAINPLGDLYKTQVRQISEAMELPESILNKAPSADLWEGQQDEDEIGFTYRDIDRLLYLLIDERWSASEITSSGIELQFVDQLISRVRRNQFKRRPPIIAKISERTIEREFRYPRDWGV